MLLAEKPVKSTHIYVYQQILNTSSLDVNNKLIQNQNSCNLPLDTAVNTMHLIFIVSALLNNIFGTYQKK